MTQNPDVADCADNDFILLLDDERGSRTRAPAVGPSSVVDDDSEVHAATEFRAARGNASSAAR